MTQDTASPPVGEDSAPGAAVAEAISAEPAAAMEPQASPPTGTAPGEAVTPDDVASDAAAPPDDAAPHGAPSAVAETLPDGTAVAATDGPSGMADTPDGGVQAAADSASDEDCLRLAEALIFASATPVTPRALAQLLPDSVDADTVIAALRARYAGRGVELADGGNGVLFRTAPDLAPRLRKVIEVPRRLPRVAMETLAIIAYHQPCTRAEIEEIRGVSLSQQTLDSLLEASLVAPQGRREVPGRPTLWGTTPKFLVQFGLKDLRDLPSRGDLLLEPPTPSGVSAAPALTSDLQEPPGDAATAPAPQEAGDQAVSAQPDAEAVTPPSAAITDAPAGAGPDPSNPADSVPHAGSEETAPEPPSDSPPLSPR